MKKLLIATNALLLCIILFQACHPKSTCSWNVCKDYSNIKLLGVIDTSIARQMSLDYAADIGKRYIASDTDKPDALSISFDIEKIKNFIWMIQDAACKDNLNDSIKLGIRIYYAKYPKNIDGWGIPCSDTLKHTVFMVPAYKVGQNWYDWTITQISPERAKKSYPDSLTNYYLKKVPIWGVLGTRVTTAAGNNVSTPNGQDDNHGDLGPPPGAGTYPTNQ